MRENLRPLMSSARGDWKTPKEHYAALDQEFHFTGDVTNREGGFDWEKQCWVVRRGRMIFGNPEYGRNRKIDKFLRAALTEMASHRNLVIVILLPSRTGNSWFHDFILPLAKTGDAEIRFIRGRLHFDDAKNAAPFDSMDVILRSKVS